MRWRPPASGRWGWGSPISARRWCCGTAAPSVRSRRPSSGRIGAPATAAASSGRPASRRCSAGAPGWSPIPISRPPSSSGCSAIPSCVAAPGEGSSPRGRWETWLAARLTGGGSRAITPTRAHAPLRSRLARLAPGAARHFRGTAGRPGITSPSGFIGDTDPALGVRPADRRARGDQQSALFGQGHRGAGEEHLRHRRVPAGVSRHQCAGAAPRRARDGGLRSAWRAGLRARRSVFIAGAAVQWLRDGLRIIESARERSAGAKRREHGGSGVRACVRRPGHAALGSAEARGPSWGSPAAARVRTWCAALEAIASSCADLLHAMTGTGELHVPALRVDGGGAANDWMMQFQADVLGLPVERPDMVEDGARRRGARRLALDVEGAARPPAAGPPDSPRRWIRRSGEDVREWERAVLGGARLASEGGVTASHTASTSPAGVAPSREAAATSSTSRTFRSSASGPNGLGRNVARDRAAAANYRRVGVSGHVEHRQARRWAARIFAVIGSAHLGQHHVGHQQIHRTPRSPTSATASPGLAAASTV